MNCALKKLRLKLFLAKYLDHFALLALVGLLWYFEFWTVERSTMTVAVLALLSAFYKEILTDWVKKPYLTENHLKLIEPAQSIPGFFIDERHCDLEYKLLSGQGHLQGTDYKEEDFTHLFKEFHDLIAINLLVKHRNDKSTNSTQYHSESRNLKNYADHFRKPALFWVSAKIKEFLSDFINIWRI